MVSTDGVVAATGNAWTKGYHIFSGFLYPGILIGDPLHSRFQLWAWQDHDLSCLALIGV